MHFSRSEILAFQNVVWEQYAILRRDLPWRIPDHNNEYDPYKILVSEIMLQQTQVTRVIDKYNAFLTSFPTVTKLADSELGDIIRAWIGLGYNRRAKYLWLSAQVLSKKKHWSQDRIFWESLPGVGTNTAGAILVYAYNKPEVFIETNVRSVFLHHFFMEQDKVTDVSISEVVSITIDKNNPREWYWALMDYGSFLKKQQLHHLHQSAHYVKQSKFNGSEREIRGKVLKQISTDPKNFEELNNAIDDKRLVGVLHNLLDEGLIKIDGNYYIL